jgi:hypothetical protein
MDVKEVKEKAGGLFGKLPFARMAEKIPAETRAKVPILNKAIPWANQIVCGIAVVLLVTIIACSGKKEGGTSTGGGSAGGGRAAPATDFSYELARDGDLEYIRITKYTGRGGKVVIPEKIEDYIVGEIGRRAFRASFIDTDGNYIEGAGDDITEVVIPGHVFWINTEAFRDCSNLTKVTIERTYVIVGTMAFSGCENLSELIIPDKNDNPEIGANVLVPEYDENLKYSFGASAFQGCKKLPLKMRERLKAMGFAEP